MEENKNNTIQNSNVNQNFSSILNVQQHNQTTIENILGIMLKGWEQYTNKQDPNKQDISEQLLNELNVNSEDFQQYKTKVKEGFIKWEQNRGIDMGDGNFMLNIDLGQYLVQCYKNVPANYFEEKFVFDFSMLTKNIGQINDSQEDMAEYLDEVDLNLFYQIQSRFNEFLTVILNFNQMKNSIDNCLNQISMIKNYNKTLKQNLVDKSLDIARKKTRILNMERVVNMMSLLKTVHKTIPTINELVEGGKYQYAVDLLSNSEETYNQQKFSELKSLAKYKNSIFTARKKLESNVVTMFQQHSMTYIIEGLAYQKGGPGGLQNRSSSETGMSTDRSMLDNSTFLNDTMDQNKFLNMSQYMEEQRQNNFPWTSEPIKRNMEKEEQVARIVLQSYNLVMFSTYNYRTKLTNHLKDFYNSYLQDLKDYIIEHLDQEQIKKFQSHQQLNKIEEPGNELEEDENCNDEGQTCQQEPQELTKIDYSKFQIEDLLQKIPLELFIKIVNLFIEIMKKTVKQQLNLNHTVIQNIILHVQHQIDLKKQIGTNENIEKDISQFTKPNEIIDDFYQIIHRMITFFNEKAVALISMKDMKDCSELNIFKKIITLFQNWEYFIENDVQRLMDVQIEGKEQLTPKLQKILNQHNTTQFKKIQMSSFNMQRMQIERNFLNQFHKIQTKLLKEDLEQDKWIPADIPFEYYQIFQDLIEDIQEGKTNQEHNLEHMDFGDQMTTERLVEDGDITERSRVEDSILDPSILITNNNDPSQNKIKILKNEVHIEGIKYKITSAYIGFIKKIQNYLKLAFFFLKGQSRTDVIIMLSSFINYYQDRSHELILDGKAQKYKVLKKITAKNLAISLLCLDLTHKHILPGIQKQIKKEIKEEIVLQKTDLVIEEYDKHIKKVFSTISQILVDLLQVQCSALKKLKWNEQSEKINCPTRQTAQVLDNMRSMYLVIEDYFMKEQLLIIFEKVMEEIINIYLPLFIEISITTKLAAKRIKDELEYVQQDMGQLGFISILPKEQFLKFENEISRIIDEKCYSYLAENN